MNKPMRFRKIGGTHQLYLSEADDLKQILELDEAQWAVNGMPLEAVIIDKEFLGFLDTDDNKRIRPEELKIALKWLLEVLRDHSGINTASDTLELSALNPDHPDTEQLRASAKLVLSNLKAENRNSISLAQVRDRKNIIAAANNNGDGIITPESSGDPETRQYIADIIACCGSKSDLSGDSGIDETILDTFLKNGASHLEWLKTGIREDKNSPYGAKVADFYILYASVRDKLNEFFSFCGGLADDDDARFGATKKTDPMDLDEMGKFIRTAPIAIPNSMAQLHAKKWLNPVWKNNILEFLAMAKELGAIESSSRLTEPEWREIEKNFAVRDAWNAKKSNDNFDILTVDQLELYLSQEKLGELKKMIADDLSVAREIAGADQLRKLILLQQNMMEFCNNYISLDRLFDPRKLSILQPGVLIMDGRHFTLASYVVNIAEHKKIISRSNICVIYLELSTGKPPESRKMTLAVAITSGTMRNIFIGKTGVFITGDSVEWDAKVIDLVQQPVSFSEALQMPFYKFGEFAGKQADRFFSAKSKDVETTIGNQVNNAAKGNLPSLPGMTAPQPTQTPAVSGSMMLMGGGVGLAALGSSVAFIANSLKSVSFWNVAAVFLGIALTISAPILLVSVIKLWNRCISDFYSASGWAINPKMRLSRKMGGLFTFKPPFPQSILLRGDLIKFFSGINQQTKKFSTLKTVGYLLAAAAGVVAGYWFFTTYTGISFF